MRTSKSAKKTIRNPIQDRAQKTVQAILTATTRVLSSDGYEGLNTNRVAEVAGVGIGSLYQYFKNKDQIIHSLIKSYIYKRYTLVQEHLSQSKPQELEVAVENVIEALIAAKRANHKFERILELQIPRMGALSLLEKFDQELVDYLKDYFKPFAHELNSEQLEFSLYVTIQAVRGTLVGVGLHRPQYLEKPELKSLITQMVLAILMRKAC